MNNQSLLDELQESVTFIQSKLSKGNALTEEDFSSLFLLNFLEEEKNEKSS